MQRKRKTISTGWDTTLKNQETKKSQQEIIKRRKQKKLRREEGAYWISIPEYSSG